MEKNKNKPIRTKAGYETRIVNYLLGKGTWLPARKLADNLGVSRKNRADFFAALERTIKKGNVTEKNGKYRAKPKGNTVEVTIISVKDGFGFAGSPELESDIFIPGRFLMGAMPGDLVLVRKTEGRRGGSAEGEVIRILEENEAPFIGVFHEHGGVCEIMPDSGSRIPVKVARINALGAKENDKVLGHLIKRGENHFNHKGAVVQVFGASTGAAACSEAILAGVGIEKYFEDEVIKEAELIEKHGIDEKDFEGRTDLRGELIFTIDGADTKDIDDAISLTKTPYGWRLGVHIADVSHYVLPDTAIDTEAFNRGTSVYYANSVVPMLPVELSNGICSLNEGENRLAFSAIMTLDDEGNLTDYTFKKTVIRSRIQGVYSEINSIIKNEADKPLLKKYEGLTDTIMQMYELGKLLQNRRFAQGAINLQSSEAKIIIDENGLAANIIPRTQGISEGIIEEFMLKANEAAATLAVTRNIPFVYRVHDNPSPDKIEKFCILMDAIGVNCADLKMQVSSASMAKILRSVQGHELELLVNNQILRSMAKAKYSEVNAGHFGLVLNNYAHFTSPIRRYPDLSIHRILTSVVSGVSDAAVRSKYASFVQLSSTQSTDREQRAMHAERDCEDCYKAEYMRRHLGDIFDGIISSVTARGLYVRLENTVEGMIRLDVLPRGKYDYDGAVKLTELISGTVYRVGMPVRVKVTAADVSSGNVDFVIEGL